MEYHLYKFDRHMKQQWSDSYKAVRDTLWLLRHCFSILMGISVCYVYKEKWNVWMLGVPVVPSDKLYVTDLTE
jgi:hypothetical protein